MQFEKEGKIYTFELDVDKIADMEEKDPSFDLIGELDGMDSIKFSTLRKLADFVGLDFPSMKEKGLDFKDLMEIITGAFEELGFTSGKEERPAYSKADASPKI